MSEGSLLWQLEPLLIAGAVGLVVFVCLWLILTGKSALRMLSWGALIMAAGTLTLGGLYAASCQWETPWSRALLTHQSIERCT